MARITPDFEKIGPAMVHLFLEVHPLYYRGPMGYNEYRQVSSAKKVFAMVEDIFSPEEGDDEVMTYDRGIKKLDSLVSTEGTRELLALLRPRLWWTDLKSMYTMTDAVKISSEEDMRWFTGGYESRVKAVIEDLILQGSSEKEPGWENEVIRRDWRYVMMAPRPLSARAKMEFLESIQSFDQADVYRLFFKAFREMPILGESMTEILASFSDTERISINRMSPMFALYMSDMSEPVYDDLLSFYNFKTLDETFRNVRRKNMLPDEMREFWETMPHNWQDKLFDKQRREVPRDPDRTDFPWLSAGNNDELLSPYVKVLRKREDKRNLITAEPSAFLRRKNISNEDRLLAVLLNGKNIKFIKDPYLTPDIMLLAAVNPSPLTIRGIENKRDIRNYPASGLEFIPEPVPHDIIDAALVCDPNNFAGIPHDQRHLFADRTLEIARERDIRLHPTVMEALVRTEVPVDLLAKTVLFDPSILNIMDWRLAPTIKHHPENFDILATILVNGWNEKQSNPSRWKIPQPVLSLLKPETIRDLKIPLVEDAIRQNAMNLKYYPIAARTEKMMNLAIEFCDWRIRLGELGVTRVPQVPHQKIAVSKNPNNLLDIQTLLRGNHASNEVIIEAAIHHPIETAKIMGYESAPEMFEKIHSKALADEFLKYSSGTPGLASLMRNWLDHDTLEKEKAKMDKPKIIVNGNINGNLNVAEAGSTQTVNSLSATPEVDVSSKGKSWFGRLRESVTPGKQVMAAVAMSVMVLSGVHYNDPTVLPKPLASVAQVATNIFVSQVNERAPGLSTQETMQRVLDTAMAYPSMAKTANRDGVLIGTGDKQSFERLLAFRTKCAEFEMDINALLEIKKTDPIKFAENYHLLTSRNNLKGSAVNNVMLEVFNGNLEPKKALDKLHHVDPIAAAVSRQVSSPF